MKKFLLVVIALFLTLPLVAQDRIPPGTIIAYAGKVTAPPAGWLVCNGQEVAVANYKGLYAVIGTVYGGDGVNKFRLPDFRSRFAMGAGQGEGLTNRALGAKGGEENHVLTVNELPAHSHIQTTDDTGGAAAGNNQRDGNGGDVSTGVNSGRTRNEGGNAGHNTIPPFVAVHFLIKY